VRRAAPLRAVGLALGLAFLAAATLGAFYEWGGPARRGVRQLKKGEDAAALHSFGEARAEQPASGAVRYDQGLAFRKLGLTDSSRTAFQDAMRLQGAPARSASAFNLGNDALRHNQLEDAIQRYRESLLADSRRADAKKNLEEAIRRLRQAKPPPTPPTQGGGGSQGPSGPSGGGGGGGNQNQGPPSAGQEPSPPKATGPIPNRSEAELWLDALESERRSERQREKQRSEPRQENVRDW
jgi:tetratricopeptide (TPR) repeat protein